MTLRARGAEVLDVAREQRLVTINEERCTTRRAFTFPLYLVPAVIEGLPLYWNSSAHLEEDFLSLRQAIATATDQ